MILGMKKLNQDLVAKVSTAFTGKKLEKFMASVQVINDSLAQGSWVPRGAAKAGSGFYQGIAKAFLRNTEGWTHAVPVGSVEGDCVNAVESLLNYGKWRMPSKDGGYPELRKATKTKMPKTDKGVIDLGLKVLRQYTKIKASDELIHAWAELIEEVDQIFEVLDNARPVPKITAIGLSPKVTMTLKECNLDLDLPSIRPAKLEARTRQLQKWNKIAKAMELIFAKDGKPVMETYYIVVWTPGILHNQSRFKSGCQACGKWIPSGRYVPVEARDKKSGNLISMWLGCDCARNIFGIKDEGVEKDPRTK